MTYKRFILLCSNSVIQYFNYAIFSFSSIDLAKNFMPGEIDQHKILNLFALIILTVLARPLGSICFGSIGDKIGRKFALIYAGIFSSLGAMIVPFIDSYEIIGVSASILLIISRMIFLSGLSGEIDGIRLFISENLSPKKQNFGNGLITLFTQSGALAASASLVALENYHHGWKICFLAGGVLGFVFSLARLIIPETIEFTKEREKPSQFFKVTFLQILNGQFKLLLKTSVASGTIGCFYQFFIIFLPIFCKIKFNLDLTYYIPYGILLYGIGGSIFGYMADKYGGYKIIQYIIVIISLNLISLGFLMKNYHNIIPVILLTSSFFISGFSVPFQILLKQNINVGIRYRIFSLGHSLGSLFISAPTAFICTKIGFETSANYIVIYPIIFAYISFMICLSFKQDR